MSDHVSGNKLPIPLPITSFRKGLTGESLSSRPPGIIMCLKLKHNALLLYRRSCHRSRSWRTCVCASTTHKPTRLHNPTVERKKFLFAADGDHYRKPQLTKPWRKDERKVHIPSQYISNATPTLKVQGTLQRGHGKILRARGPRNLLRDSLLKKKRREHKGWRSKSGRSWGKTKWT